MFHQCGKQATDAVAALGAAGIELEVVSGDVNVEIPEPLAEE